MKSQQNNNKIDKLNTAVRNVLENLSFRPFSTVKVENILSKIAKQPTCLHKIA